MIEKPKLKKLKLSVETIKRLQEAELSMVTGASETGCGGVTPSCCCWSNKCNSSPVHAPKCTT